MPISYLFLTEGGLKSIALGLILEEKRRNLLKKLFIVNHDVSRSLAVSGSSGMISLPPTKALNIILIMMNLVKIFRSVRLSRYDIIMTIIKYHPHSIFSPLCFLLSFPFTIKIPISEVFPHMIVFCSCPCELVSVNYLLTKNAFNFVTNRSLPTCV